MSKKRPSASRRNSRGSHKPPSPALHADPLRERRPETATSRRSDAKPQSTARQFSARTIRLFRVAAVALPALLVVLSLTVLVARMQHNRTLPSAQGTVVDVLHPQGRSCPIVDFTVDKQPVRAQGPCTSQNANSSGLRVGTAVTVHYDPQNPGNLVASRASYALPTVGLIIGNGLLLVVLTLLLLGRSADRQGRDAARL